MMAKYKLATIEMEKKIPTELYNRIDAKWNHATITEKKIREGTLSKIMFELTTKKKKTVLEKYRNIFFPKYNKMNSCGREFMY